MIKRKTLIDKNVNMSEFAFSDVELLNEQPKDHFCVGQATI